MLSNRLAVVALGVACVVAAAGGGYIAVRQSEAPAVAGVQETEGVVGSTPTPPSEPVKATPPPRASRAASNSRSQAARKPEAPQTVARAEPPAPTLDRSWPSSASSAPAAPAIDATPAPVQQEEQLPEPVRAPEPPEPTFDELLVSADSVVGVQTETALSTERSHVEDRVEARVSRDVRVGGRVAIPAGTRVIGSVTSVERGGKMRERATLGIRFHTLAFADGTETPITTETIYRYGDAPGNKSAAKIGGGAVAGAILGAIIGGGKGAAIGAATGAAGGGAAVAASDRSEATLPAGAEVTARILSPVTVTVER
jgi:hypothetical protein